MNLDVGTLFSVTVLVMALLGILLIGTWLQNRGMRALAWWGAAYLVGGMSIWLLGARGGTIQDLLSIDIANALLFVACGLTWSGARLFDGRGVKPVAMLIGTFMWVGACQIPGFMASLDARVVLSSIIISGYTMVIAFEFWRGRGEPLGSRWPAIVVLAAHACLFMLRIPIALSVGVSGEHSSILNSSWLPILLLESLLYVIAFAFIMMAMSKERLELKQKLASLIDPLTGIANRRAFFEETIRRLEPGSKDARPLVAILFDLDRFKKINDKYGHSMGDLVLKIFADKARANLRPNDYLARLGGEEFAAILSGIELSTAFALAEQIRISFANELSQGRYNVGATVSAGLALLRDGETEIDSLLARADHALYAAKARGRDRVEIADPDRAQAWRPEQPGPRPPSVHEPVLVPSPPLAMPNLALRQKVGVR
ncbi:MAG TPA: GGDEF domain-containing protein [Xanthobacteraceae bacterium]|jgi:diguanylate cyclase (GGDEF)-like protein|nr:GGDEF domain-containing protein [Xanthobacteraceae bacterium]